LIFVDQEPLMLAQHHQIKMLSHHT